MQIFKNISWAQGFFRLWVVYGLTVVSITGIGILAEEPPSSIMLYSEKSDRFKVIKEYTRDKDLFDEANKRGLILSFKTAGDTLWFFKTIPENTRELKISKYRKDHQSSYDSRLWNARIRD